MAALSYAGLTAHEVVLQSRACHPDWNAADHVMYLTCEEPFTEQQAVQAVASMLRQSPASVQAEYDAVK